jgi:chemotaxis protein methyltransferase CheR
VDAAMTSMRAHRSNDLELLLEDIFQIYHHDFRSYVRSSLSRRIAHALSEFGHSDISTLRARLRQDPRVFAAFLEHLTIQVSEMFRNPSYWRALRERVVPHLSTHPFLRVWVAGCGAGEEAYSMAILLHEEGLLERAQIYATDIIASSLERAKGGVYELARVRHFSDNYFAAGGEASLADYYATSAQHAVFAPELQKRILFSDHSLATDFAFAEVQLISCRNVFIYFERTLQDRAVRLFDEALCGRGFLGLGDKETLMFSPAAGAFEPFVPDDRIYRKRGLYL